MTKSAGLDESAQFVDGKYDMRITDNTIDDEQHKSTISQFEAVKRIENMILCRKYKKRGKELMEKLKTMP